MKHFLAFCIGFICSFAFCFGQSAEQILVKQSFNSYKSAILNDKGEDAAKFVDNRTIKYYGDILELVKNADSTSIDSLSIMDKLVVFLIRLKASREDIISFDGQKLFAYAVNSGMVGKNSVADNSLGAITIDKGFAKGQLVVKGKSQPLFFHFYKESNQWKMDLTSLFPMTNSLFQNMADESGQGTNEYLFSLLEILNGKKPGPEVWQAVK